MADRQGASLHAEGPASAVVDFVAAVDFTEGVEDSTEAAVEAEAAVAGGGNRSLVLFLVDREP
jgi:hypothetical protein